MIFESNSSAFFLITFITSSDNKGAFLPVIGFTYSCKSFIVSEKDLRVFLCKFEIEILAANEA